jgi:hypothetical protein
LRYHPDGSWGVNDLNQCWLMDYGLPESDAIKGGGHSESSGRTAGDNQEWTSYFTDEDAVEANE